MRGLVPLLALLLAPHPLRPEQPARGSALLPGTPPRLATWGRGVQIRDPYTGRVEASAGAPREFAPAGCEFAGRAAVFHPGAAVVERNPGRVKGYATAGAQAGRAAVRAAEEVQPEGPRLASPEDSQAMLRSVWSLPALAAAFAGMRNPDELVHGPAGGRGFRPLAQREFAALAERGKAPAGEWGPLRGAVA